MTAASRSRHPGGVNVLMADEKKQSLGRAILSPKILVEPIPELARFVLEIRVVIPLEERVDEKLSLADVRTEL